MIIRKIITFILTSLLVPLFITTGFSTVNEASFKDTYLVLILYGTPFILLYGLPVSFLSEGLTKRLNSWKRLSSSFMIHLFFGVLCTFIFYFIVGDPFHMYWSFLGKILLIGSTVASVLFWSIDEWLRKKVDWESIQSAM